MKYQRDKTKIKFKYLSIWISAMALLFYASLLLIPIAIAQNERDVIAQPYKINGKEAKEYLMEKYKLKKHDVTSTLKQTPNGPSGKVHLRGDITPRNVAIAAGITDIKDRSRAIAKAFLQEEASLFGIAAIEEIREEGIFSNKGRDGEYTRINYRRYIDNLPLMEMYISLTVGPAKEITWADAYLVPVPPELYKAVKKKTLIEAEIRGIVEDDLKADAESPETDLIVKADIDRYDPKKMKLRKHVISSQPYVVWYVEAVWAYTIDAFTGEILKKAPTWIIN